MDVPVKGIVFESIRNLYFHVCMWMAMMTVFIVSVVNSIRYLRTQDYKYDIYASSYAATGVVFGLLGYSTGAIWANYTWVTENGSLANVMKEPKLLGAAIGVLIYCAYFVLRGSLTDMDKRARVSAVYNIFAFAMLFPSIWILPRLTTGLHPGAETGGTGGNPALNMKDVAPIMKAVFYPAMVGWTLLGVWITTLKIRIKLLTDKNILHA